MTEKNISREMVVNDAIKEHPLTIEVFTRFAIDSCCGGAVSIEEAAERDGVKLSELLEALNEAADKSNG